MARLEDVNPNDFISELAETLKSMPDIKPPKWSVFVKTGHYKERPPVKSDWWYVRAAAVLRTVYRLGPVGTSKLRTKYGGKKNRGVASEHAYKGSGSIIRKILQQLEKAGLLAKGSVGMHKGRVVTPKGKSLLNAIAKKVDPARISVKAAALKEAKKQDESSPQQKKAKKSREKSAEGGGKSAGQNAQDVKSQAVEEQP